MPVQANNPPMPTPKPGQQLPDMAEVPTVRSPLPEGIVPGSSIVYNNQLPWDVSADGVAVGVQPQRKTLRPSMRAQGRNLDSTPTPGNLLAPEMHSFGYAEDGDQAA